MNEIAKEHPLRPIILEFDLKKTAPDFETKALEAYYRMHDKTWEAQQQLQRHKEALFGLDVEITELEYRLLPIEQQLDFLEAGLRLVDNPKLPVVEEEFSIDLADFNRDVINHHEELVELHERVIAEQQWFNGWADLIYDNEDWFDEADDEGSALIHQVFSRYEEVAVDIVSLDRDQQEFFGAVAEVSKLQTEYFDYGDQVFAMYTNVHERAESVYRRAERINDSISGTFN